MSSGFTHEFQTPIRAAPSRIFEALTRDDELEAWFAEHASVDPRVGGHFRFWGRHTVGAPGEPVSGGAVTDFDPDARLGFEWDIYGVPGTVTLSITPDQDTDIGAAQTRVAVRHEVRGRLDQPRPEQLIDDWWRFSLGNLAAHASGHGDVLRPDFADPEPQIRLTFEIAAPPETVFRALTDPEALREWFGAPDPVVEPRVGGRYELGWTYTIDGREVEGGPMEIQDIVPNRRLVVSWPDWRGDASVPTQSIAWELEPTDGGTLLTLVHAGFVRTVDFSDYPFGWAFFMAELSKVATRSIA